MRILYLTQWFEPEPNIVKGIPFVRALENAGHKVTVVTAFPNYPTGRIYPGYRLRAIQKETIGDVRVVRLPIYPSHDSSALRRSLNYLSFFVSVFLYCLLRRDRFDLAYVYHPPITVGLAAALAGMLRPLPFVLDVQDLWPDTIAATEIKGAARLVPLLQLLCKAVYREAAAIVVQSAGMGRLLIDRGVPESKVTTIFNWADVGLDASGHQEITDSGSEFTIVYGGNLGRAQALEALVDAAGLLQAKRSDIRILVYGDGVDAESLVRRASEAGITILRFRGRVPKAEITEQFARADALLLHLADDPLFKVTIPSKTQFYLAMGRPIVAGVAGEAAEILRQSGAALVVPPSDPAALAAAIGELADMPTPQREAMGGSGRQFQAERMSFETGIERTLAVLEGTYAKEQTMDMAAAQ